MREPLPLRPGGDAQESGAKDGLTWASLRGEVKKPIGEVLRLMLDHDTTKSPRVDETEVENLAAPHFLARHVVRFLIKPFLFIKIRWREDWAYEVTKGASAAPEEVLISYEKTEGTSHIEHLCGSAVLRKLGAAATDVFQYEEAKATQRSEQDTMNGLVGTLQQLRKP